MHKNTLFYTYKYTYKIIQKISIHNPPAGAVTGVISITKISSYFQ